MAWVRIHDGAMTHPKLVGLSDKAFRLWIWGLSYSQQHLTDGRVPAIAMPPRLRRASVDLIVARLWEASGEQHYAIHDYLHWNDAREFILKKRAEAKRRMAGARERRWSDDPFAQSDRANTASISRAHVPCRVGEDAFSSEGVEGEPPLDPLDRRAGDFVHRYVALYAQYRNGAKWFRRKPALEFEAAKRLCGTWDDARLEKLAGVFLKSDDDWISRTDRGLLIFESKASWCDDRLRQWEAQH